MSGPKGFFCSNYKAGCGVGAYKSVELAAAKYTVSDAEFARLLENEQIEIHVGEEQFKLRYELAARKIIAAGIA